LGAGLPDSIFANQKYQFWYIFEGLAIENVCYMLQIFGIFTTILVFLWPFGKFCCHLVHIGMLYEEKSGNLDWV
jgi:hypothetical protein